jgi:heptosyltransferase-2
MSSRTVNPDTLLSKTSRLLVIQPLVGIGDMLWHKPWIDLLASHCDVTLATKPTAKAKTIFHDAPTGFQVLDIDRSQRGTTGRHDGVLGLFRLAMDFRRSGADTALILHYSSRYAIAARLAGISVIFGYGSSASRWLYTAGYGLSADWRKRHAIDRVAEYARLNNFAIEKPLWRMSASGEGIDEANTLLADIGFASSLNRQRAEPVPYLVIGVGAMHPERQWGAENFANLISSLLSDQNHYHVMVIGGPTETALIEQMNVQLRNRHSVAELKRTSSFTGSLSGAIALMQLSSGYIGNDTSLLNFSALLGVPCIGLFSHSRPLAYSAHIITLDVLSDDDYGMPGIIHKITPTHVMARAAIIWPDMSLSSPPYAN